MNKVEKFISSMKKNFPEELEFTFYRGYCYWFALILAERFKGSIWFNPVLVHFATYIKGQLYDIYGKVEPGRDPITGAFDENNALWLSWEEFQLNNREAVDSIVKSCIKKD